MHSQKDTYKGLTVKKPWRAPTASDYQKLVQTAVTESHPDFAAPSSTADEASIETGHSTGVLSFLQQNLGFWGMHK